MDNKLAQTMPTLVGVGACYLDTILTVDHYPPEDEKLRAKKLERRRGGNVPNSLEVLQQLVSRRKDDQSFLILVSVLPNSSSTAVEQIRSSLGDAVDLSHCLFRESSSEAPSSYIIRSLTTDSRTLVNYNDLEELTAAEFENVVDRLTSDADDFIYHFEGRIPDVTVKCMEYIRKRHFKARISVECEKADREGLQALAQSADIVFYSKSWAIAQGYSSAEKCVRSQATKAPQASYLFCTWGADGATAFSKQDGTVATSDAYLIKGRKVVDTVGAGDSFIAGALYGLLYNHEWDLATIVRFANEVAGRKVVQEGFSGIAARMGTWLE